MRPNQRRNSSARIQLSAIAPTSGPKDREAQMATSSAVIEMASLRNPRTIPTSMETKIPVKIIMSMIGIRDVAAA